MSKTFTKPGLHPRKSLDSASDTIDRDYEPSNCEAIVTESLEPVLMKYDPPSSKSTPKLLQIEFWSAEDGLKKDAPRTVRRKSDGLKGLEYMMND